MSLSDIDVLRSIRYNTRTSCPKHFMLNLQRKYNLPDKLKVQVIKSKNGDLTAILADYPGCITYADSPSELIESLNDAILTYFEVPRNEALNADFVYVPQKQLTLNKRLVDRRNDFISVPIAFSYA